MCAPDLAPMAHAFGGVPDWRISPGLPHRGTRRLCEPELPCVARADEGYRDGRMGSHDCHLLVARRDASSTSHPASRGGVHSRSALVMCGR